MSWSAILLAFSSSVISGVSPEESLWAGDFPAELLLMEPELRGTGPMPSSNWMRSFAAGAAMMARAEG